MYADLTSLANANTSLTRGMQASSGPAGAAGTSDLGSKVSLHVWITAAGNPWFVTIDAADLKPSKIPMKSRSAAVVLMSNMLSMPPNA